MRPAPVGLLTVRKRERLHLASSGPEWDYSYIPDDESTRGGIVKSFRLPEDLSTQLEELVEGQKNPGFRSHSHFMRWAAMNGLAYWAQRLDPDSDFVRRVSLFLAMQRSKNLENDYDNAEQIVTSYKTRLGRARRDNDEELLQEILVKVRDTLTWMRFKRMREDLGRLLEEYE